jgi:hypothetical protein
VNRLTGRRRLLLATLVALVGAGVAGGIALARGDRGSAADGPALVLARGKFHTVTWGTTGTAVIERDTSGRLVLRFDRAFGTRQAPDLYVYLDQQDPRKNGNRGKYLLVGSLANSHGGQHYKLPPSAARMTGYLVEIYCAECDKTNAFAKLTPTS